MIELVKTNKSLEYDTPPKAINIDDTLSKAGEAADAKAVGDAIKNLPKPIQTVKAHDEGSVLTLPDVAPESMTVKAYSKNLLDFELLRDENNYEKHLNGSGFWFFPLKVKPNIDITVSRATDKKIADGAYLCICNSNQYIGKNLWMNHSTMTPQKKIIMPAQDNGGMIYIAVNGNSYQRLLDEIGYLQVEYGNQATPYTPYISDFSVINSSDRGKNRIPFPYTETTKTDNGITFSVDKDGVIRLSGTATAVARFTLHMYDDIPVLKAGKYTLSGADKKGGYSSYVLEIRFQNANGEFITQMFGDVGTGATFDIPEGASKLYLRINVFKDFNANGVVIKPQLERGTYITPFSPYAFTPKSSTLITDSKNLFRYPYGDTTKTINGITFTDNGDGTITADGKATDRAQFVISPKLGNSWTSITTVQDVFLSGCPKGGANNSYSIIQTNYGYKDIGNGILIRNPNTFNTFVINIEKGRTVHNLLFKPMLSYFMNDKEYEGIVNAEYPINKDGTIDGVVPVSPNMSIYSLDKGIYFEADYRADIKRYVDNKINISQSSMPMMLDMTYEEDDNNVQL